MTFYSLTFLAFSMSTDAFAASVSKGALLTRPSLARAVRTGLLFGIIEALTPLIGWCLGITASQWVMQWDHWIAFTLLAVLGGRMIYTSFRQITRHDTDTAITPTPSSTSLPQLVLTAIATSIDALVVGVSLAFADVNIIHACLAIGFSTALMVMIGTLLGQRLGGLFGRRAEMLGGVILIAIGLSILIEHLSA